MPIFTRIQRLFRADVHAMLDNLEEPDVLLKQAMREMQDELRQQRQRVQMLELKQSQLAEHINRLSDQEKKIQPELDLCFDANNETLTRTLLRRSLETQKRREALQATMTDLMRELEDARRFVADAESRYEHLAKQAECYQAKTPEHAEAFKDTGVVVTDADVEIALLREKQKRGLK